MSPTTPVKTSNAASAFAFIGAELLALPGIAFALYVYLIGRVAGGRGWLSAMFEVMFSGFIVLPMLLLSLGALFFAGMFAAARPWAAVTLVLVNIVAVVVAWAVVRPSSVSEFLFWLPTLASVAIAGYLAWRGLAPPIAQT
jgi:hypothetical protein